MRCSTIETIFPATPAQNLPLLLEQRPSAASSLLMLAILLPVTIALVTPFALLGHAAAASPQVRAVLGQNPLVATQIGLGLSFWFVLFAWPLKRLTDGFASRRSIEIDRNRVTAVDKTLLGSQTWTEPLASYAGIVHHVRASLSGLRHELILAHETREHTVLLTISDRISQAEIDRMCALLGLRELPSRELYRIGAPRPAPVPASLAIVGAAAH